MKKSPAEPGFFLVVRAKKTKRKNFAFRCAQFGRHFFGASTGKMAFFRLEHGEKEHFINKIYAFVQIC